MADDQVKYKDLFDEGIIGEVQKLTNEITSLKDAIAAAKTEANGLRDNLRGAGTATREQQQQTAADAAAVEALNRQVKDLTDKLAKLEERKKRYSKLTDTETASVEALRQALAGSAQDQIKATQAIDMQSKSYNELYQTYNALKDALNRMTVAERENSQAGKEMVNRAKEIRDTLNNLQQATGNYTLNVGNYMSALNGLQFQTQQVLREIPSAQNLSQFFLAISNNIPMFADALARYNQGLPEIKAKLAAVTAEIARQNAAMAAMNVQSAEYAAAQARLNELQRQQQQLQGASVSGWRAILKAVGSWQTLLIAGLLLLRKMPDIIKAISKWWDRWRNGVKEVKNEMTAVAAMARLQADVIKKSQDEVSELQLIAEKLKTVKQGTDEWVAGVKTVNDITKQNLDTTKATPAEVQKVTDAYIKQARQLAKNAILTDMIAKSEANLSLREVAYNPGTYGTARQTLGLEIGSKDEKEFNKLFTEMNEAIRAFNEKERRKVWKSVRDAAGNKTMKKVLEEEGEAGTNRRKEMNDAIQDYRNFINKRLEVLSPDAKKKLEEQYDLIDPLKKKKDGHSYSLKDVDFLESELLDKDAVIELETNFKRRLAMLDEEQEKERLVLKEKYEKELKDLEFNKDKKLITEQQYEEQLAKLNKNYNDLIKTNYEGNFEEMGVIQRKYWNKRNELAFKEADRQEKEEKKRLKEAEQAAKDGAKAELKAAVDGWAEYKAKLIEEGKTRKQIVEAEVAAEIARLNLMLKLNRDVNGEIMSDEQKAKVQEWIALLEKLQQTGNYGDYKPGQFMGKGGANVTNERKNYANIWEVLGIDMDSNQTSALNSVFDQAKEALNSWMDARKAAADQAKELADDEVSAAENALNREIELRNQGYANNVALRERELADAKEKQKQAVEEQKKIAQEQILLDAALQTSSLITATANIIKQFPNPLVWGPMLATMWGSFAFAKIKAYQASTKSIQFREGGVMLLNGGSHESGHDVNLGIGPDGSNLRAEGHEYFAVFNKPSSSKYHKEIPAVVNAFNRGVFEDKYIKTSDAVGLLPRIIKADDGSTVDLSAVESGVGELVKQGESRWTVEGEYRVERYKNRVRRVKIG